ncbi:MAG: RNA polymerase sigma-70 factor [Bacteroidales bacterium]|nr:RNA polymerase sigma-70 factor [Bacteroidales bacterium]
MVCRKDSSDVNLVKEIRNDSKDDFKLLFERYNKKLYFFSLRYFSNDHDEAEELVQSVYISLWEHRKSLDETMPVKSYIYRSAVNYIYNYLKKKAIRNSFVEFEIQKGEVLSDQTYEQIFFNDLEKSINNIIETLPIQQQKIFQLSRFEGLSHEKIANDMNISVRTVENQIYRALKTIKSKIKEEISYLFIFIWYFFF